MNTLTTIYSTESGEVSLSADTVKKYLVNGNGNVTDQEVTMFLNLCKYQKLNPFLREAYLIKFGTSPATIVTGKEVFTKRASKLKDCKGWQAGITIVNKKGEIERREGGLLLKDEELVGGWCKVFREGWEVPMLSEVSFYEYNKGQSSWKTMPAVMIRKVAIVSALREAFPEDFQGLYSQEEMPVDGERLDTRPIDINQNNDSETEIEKQADTITHKQAQRLFAISKGNTKLVKEVLLKYKYINSADVKKTDYDAICAEIEAGGSNTKDNVIELQSDAQLPWESKD